MYLSGYGDLQSEISLLYKHQLKRKTFQSFPRWSRDIVSCNDPKAKMLEKSRMVTRKRGIDLREET